MGGGYGLEDILANDIFKVAKAQGWVSLEHKSPSVGMVDRKIDCRIKVNGLASR